MEMPHVQAEEFAPGDGVAQVELVGADDIALRGYAEELALDRIAVVPLVKHLAENRVQRGLESLARPLAVHGHVLVAVGYPDIGHGRGAQRPSHVRTDAPREAGMIDPELPYRLVRVREGEVVLRQGMGKERGIEIQPHAASLGPFDPALEVLGSNLVAVHFPACEFAVDRVKVHAVAPRDEGKRGVEVLAKLLNSSSLPGKVAGRLDPAALQGGSLAFKSTDVVALPAMQRDRRRGEASQGLLGIHAESGVHFRGVSVR